MGMDPDVPAPEGMHLPHGSAVPIWLAVATLFVLLGVVFQGIWLATGLLVLLAAGLAWIYQDVDWYNERVSTGEGVGRWGILFFIGSEVLIFGSLFATYFNFKGQGVCPDACHLPMVEVSINTVILFLSGATMHWAHHAIRMGDRRKYIGHMVLTIVLGAIFVGGQVVEYIDLIREGLTLQTHPAGSTFYLLTGTHGFHVVVGLVFLCVVLWRSVAHGQQTPERHGALEAAALYWHFVDLVWVFVFAIVYLGVL